MIIGIVGMVVCAVVSFFLWAGLHELSHAWVFKRYYPDVKITYALYPHRHNDRFFWARISWASGLLDPKQLAWVSIAPRVPDLIGIVVTAGLTLLLGWGWWVLWLAVLTGGSFIDLMVGSLGTHPESDLQRVVRGWGISKWLLRIPGMALAFIFMVVAVYGLAAG